ncbi:unnamed protein product [Paramecium octaurelia]|uniref:EF-hand domain-containing protein n=1 Tax=Paramecium octaurelia TaxID=43137 RepID=A0A8S1TWT1_PAROT|nr:unnamed protein product [Paramecium octaurelia]
MNSNQIDLLLKLINKRFPNGYNFNLKYIQNNDKNRDGQIQYLDLRFLMKIQKYIRHIIQYKKRKLESYQQKDARYYIKSNLLRFKQQDMIAQVHFNKLYKDAEGIKMHKQKLKDTLNSQRRSQKNVFLNQVTNKKRWSFKPVKGESEIIERMNKARQILKFEQNQENLIECRNKNPKNRKTRICIGEEGDIEYVVQGDTKAHQLNQEQQHVLKETLEQHIN